MLSAKLIRGSIIPGVSLIALATANVAEAAIITFDDLVTGQTSYSADGDGDGKNDVIFSFLRRKPQGLNTIDQIWPPMAYSGVQQIRLSFIRRKPHAIFVLKLA
jgi:hypothetical protein